MFFSNIDIFGGPAVKKSAPEATYFAVTKGQRLHSWSFLSQRIHPFLDLALERKASHWIHWPYQHELNN
jgi:hypothetical protein